MRDLGVLNQVFECILEYLTISIVLIVCQFLLHSLTTVFPVFESYEAFLKDVCIPILQIWEITAHELTMNLIGLKFPESVKGLSLVLICLEI